MTRKLVDTSTESLVFLAKQQTGEDLTDFPPDLILRHIKPVGPEVLAQMIQESRSAQPLADQTRQRYPHRRRHSFFH